MCDDNGSWVHSSIDKAELFQQCYRQKYMLPPEESNEYSHIVPCAENRSGFLALRARVAERFLLSIRADSGTGPDLFPARILKSCACELALPFAIICRQIIAHGRWPRLWAQHWLHPLFKRGIRSDCGNYRLIHLTSQVGKSAERFIGTLFLP